MEARSRYPEAFKQQAVAFYLSVRDYRSAREMAAELGVHFNTLYRWVRKASEQDADPAALDAATRSELRRLRKENAILKEELEISKKAAAFFAREHGRRR